MHHLRVFALIVSLGTAASLTACADPSSDSVASESPSENSDPAITPDSSVAGVDLDPAICTLEWVSRVGEQVVTVGAVVSEQSIVRDASFTDRGIDLDDLRERNVSTFNFFVVEVSISEVASSRAETESPKLASGDSILLASPVPRQLDSIGQGSIIVVSDGALNGNDAWTAQTWGTLDIDGMLQFDGSCASELQSEFGQAAKVLGRSPDSDLLETLMRTGLEQDSVINRVLEHEAPQTTVDREHLFTAAPREERQLLAGEVPRSLSSLYNVVAIDFRPSDGFVQAGRIVRIHSDLGQSYLGDSSIEGVTPILVGSGLPQTVSIADETKLPISWTEVGVIKFDPPSNAFTLFLSESGVTVETLAPDDFENLTSGAELQPLIDDLSVRWFVGE